MDPQSAICSKPKARCSSPAPDPAPEPAPDPESEPATVDRYHARPVEVIHATGIEGARHARGIAVVIDVIRSFTVSAYALTGGARECRLVTTTDEARALAATIPGALISAEENTLPIPGIAISNSPTQIKAADTKGRVIVQRSSAGTQVAAAVAEGGDIFAARA